MYYSPSRIFCFTDLASFSISSAFFTTETERVSLLDFETSSFNCSASWRRRAVCADDLFLANDIALDSHSFGHAVEGRVLVRYGGIGIVDARDHGLVSCGLLCCAQAGAQRMAQTRMSASSRRRTVGEMRIADEGGDACDGARAWRVVVGGVGAWSWAENGMGRSSWASCLIIMEP